MQMTQIPRMNAQRSDSEGGNLRHQRRVPLLSNPAYSSATVTPSPTCPRR
jgi:hypothetical protein